MASIDGIGEKTAEEIAEEYDSIAEIKKDIRSGKFAVGGVSDTKQKLLLKL